VTKLSGIKSFKKLKKFEEHTFMPTLALSDLPQDPVVGFPLLKLSMT
jgi:hypothetical protein